MWYVKASSRILFLSEVPMIKLNAKQKFIHAKALVVAVKIQRAEIETIEILQAADQVHLYKCFGLSSLLKYAMKFLKLSEPVALSSIAVARKSVQVPRLK